MGTCFGTLNGGRDTALTYSFLAIQEVVEGDGSTTCIRGTITQINRKGCYVQSIETLPADTLLRIAISDGNEDTFVSAAKVLYVHDGVGMGISFVDSTEDQDTKLNSWLLRDCHSDV
jgi:hypothetical protein